MGKHSIKNHLLWIPTWLESKWVGKTDYWLTHQEGREGLGWTFCNWARKSAESKRGWVTQEGGCDHIRPSLPLPPVSERDGCHHISGPTTSHSHRHNVVGYCAQRCCTALYKLWELCLCQLDCAMEEPGGKYRGHKGSGNDGSSQYGSSSLVLVFAPACVPKVCWSLCHVVHVVTRCDDSNMTFRGSKIFIYLRVLSSTRP